jgi:hypothetical protein
VLDRRKLFVADAADEFKNKNDLLQMETPDLKNYWDYS